MMTGFREIELGAAGQSYLHKSLQHGKHLAKNVLRDVQFAHGRVTTYLPENVTDESAKEFELGGKLPPIGERHDFDRAGRKWTMEAKPNTDSWLVKDILEFTAENRSGICIFEDLQFSPSSPWLFSSKAKDLKWVSCEGQLFYLIPASERDEKVIKKTIRAAHASWYFLCVMASLPTLPEKQWLVDRSISPAHLKSIAQAAERIVMSAYDGEGYVEWKRS